jgi:hypothetical protein
LCDAILEKNFNDDRTEPVFLYVLGTNLTTGKLGYADAAGTFTDWTGGAPVQVPAPDVAIPGPANGASTTARSPRPARWFPAAGRR